MYYLTQLITPQKLLEYWAQELSKTFHGHNTPSLTTGVGIPGIGRRWGGLRG